MYSTTLLAAEAKGLKSFVSGFFTVKKTTSDEQFPSGRRLRGNDSASTLRRRFRDTALFKCFLLRENPSRTCPSSFFAILHATAPKKRGFPLRNTLSKSSFVLRRRPFFNIIRVFFPKKLGGRSENSPKIAELGRGELLTALAATASDCGLATLSVHALEKSMAARTFPAFRLVCFL